MGKRRFREIPFNKRLIQLAKEQRKSGNLAEVVLWRELKGKKLFQLDFDRQKVIGDYIVDFYCAEAGLIIEIDGESHNYKVEYDEQRERTLQGFGLEVMHFLHTDVLNNISGVYDYLYEWLEKAKANGRW